jgi:Peptidase family M23
MKRFTRYLADLARVNGLKEGTQWLFYPGMLQESFDKWWANFGRRPAAHEGIDICYFRQEKKMTHLADSLLIPAMEDGIVLNQCDDFLGQSLVISHDGFNHFSQRVVFVYSHLAVEKEIVPGGRVEKGQIIARVFDTGKIGSKLLPHLHLSCVELMEKTPLKDLNWHLFSNRDKIHLINPVFI